jgi:hypothetical protein
VAISLVLAALLFRAYVPVGFMPASGTPFLLELCPAYSMQMPAHHGHAHTGANSHVDSCPFGSVPAGAPVAHLIAFQPPAPILPQSLLFFEPSRPAARAQRAHPPRGPPSPA